MSDPRTETTAGLIASQHAELTALRAEVHRLRQRHKETDQRLDEVTTARLADLKSVVRKIETERDTHKTTAEQLAQTVKDLHDAAKKQDEWKQGAEALSERLTKRIGAIADERNAAFADLTRLRAELKQKTDEAILRATNADLQLKNANAEIKHLYTRLEQTEKDMTADCERKIKALRGDAAFVVPLPLDAQREIKTRDEKIADLGQRIVSLSAAMEVARTTIADPELQAKRAGVADAMHRRAQIAEGAYQRLARLVKGWQDEARNVSGWDDNLEAGHITIGKYIELMREQFGRIYARLFGCQLTILGESRFMLIERPGPGLTSPEADPTAPAA